MNEPAQNLLAALGRTTLVLAAVAAVVGLVLWTTRCSSPRVHRACWALVLLQGWLLLRLPVTIPYYESPPTPSWEGMSTPAIERGSQDGTGNGALRGTVPFSLRENRDSPQRDPMARPERSDRRGSPVATPFAGLTDVPLSQPAATPFAPFRDVPPRPAKRSSLRALTTWAGQRWPVVLLGVWISGMVGLVGRWLTRYASFVRSLPPAQPAEEAWARQWADLLSERRIHRPIPIRVTARLGPVLCRLPGQWALLVPVELWRRLSPAGRLAVLRHELAHFERHDPWKSLAAHLAALPHWFNPAAWWAVRRFDEAAEWACDDAAARGDRRRAVEYSRTLVELGDPAAPHFSLSPAAQGRGLSFRVRRLLSFGTWEDSVMKKLVVMGIALGLVAVCLLRVDLVAQTPPTGGTGSLSARGEPAPADQPPVSPSPPAANVAAVGEKEESAASQPSPESEADAVRPWSTLSARRGATVHPEPEELSLQEAMAVNAAKIPLAQLRYDGKSFAEWKAEWQQELKPERRADAVTAFGAFGANGYGKEAATAILEVVRHLEIAGWEAFHPRYSEVEGGKKLSGNDLIKQAAVAAFADRGTAYRIPPAASVPVLTRELKEGNRNGHLFAIIALRRMWQEAQPAVPALRETMERDKDPTVRASAYLALALLDPSFRVSAETVRKLLKDADPVATQAVLSQLVPDPTAWIGGRGGTVFEETPQPAASVYGGMGGYPGMYPGMMSGPVPAGPPSELRPDAQPIIDVLIEAVKSEQGEKRRAAIQALGRIGPKAKGVLPALIQAFEQGDTNDRQAVLQALDSIRQSVAPAPGGEGAGMGMMPGMPGMGAMPGQGMMPGGMSLPAGPPPAKTEFDLKSVVSKLIEALDPRKPADLWLMGRIYSQYGPAAEQVLPMLHKAAGDEDPEVRRAATETLKAIGAARPGTAENRALSSAY